MLHYIMRALASYNNAADLMDIVYHVRGQLMWNVPIEEIEQEYSHWSRLVFLFNTAAIGLDS